MAAIKRKALKRQMQACIPLLDKVINYLSISGLEYIEAGEKLSSAFITLISVAEELRRALIRLEVEM